MNFLGTPRPRNKQLNPQDIPSPVQGQDMAHPRTDPLEVLRALDGPDEQDLARCDSAVCEADD